MVYNTRYITKVGILSAIAVILMFFEVPLPMMPSFLKLDASELPAILGAFLLGPIAGVGIELIKNLIHGANSQTMGIGEVANFLVGVSFILPASYLYQRYNSPNGAIIALGVGTISMMFSASLLNYFILLPLYQAVLHFPLEQIISLGTVANPQIMDLKSFITMAIAPFNLIKGIVISIFTMMIYKKIFPVLCER
ncbi:ECF transporter S component [Pelosinus sp. IPA-1]|uniref:ECF transporter S component n=1 Tax=Pelosinus sp. IPA-1 TaxID=3029569 RepID=UPI0024361620|nr:ECF transporter S component [Pelosinus sp. IPA-1]GMA99055.1 riboflavin transporter [Pelosinus sp. IPA-1]